MSLPPREGILLLNKPKGCTSFFLVQRVRKKTNIRKVGHAGTLDPAATGVMVLLVGAPYTRSAEHLLKQDKEYEGTIRLGTTTDSYDGDGAVLTTSSVVPSKEEVVRVAQQFQGTIQQVPPLYSAKKFQGKKWCDWARSGIEVPRAAVAVQVQLEILDYTYPDIRIRVACSSGTYIRSIAYDIGEALGCGAYLAELTRTRSGSYLLSECLHYEDFIAQGADTLPFLRELPARSPLFT